MSVRADKPDWFKVLNGNSAWNIVLDGEIDSEAAPRVAEALAKAGRNGADVYINSPGGNLLVGMQIGRLIRKAGATTWIGTLATDTANTFAGNAGIKRVPGYCYSACSLAFLGGVYRNADTNDKYGVHRFSSDAPPTANDLDAAQIVSAVVGAYIREMDVDPGLFDYMAERGRDSVRILATQEMAHLNVINNGRQRPEWSIEVVEGGNYLRGVQDTVFGRGKAVLLCQDHSMFVYSFYQAGSERAKSIAWGKWYHSLLVDAKTFPLPTLFALRHRGKKSQQIFGLHANRQWRSPRALPWATQCSSAATRPRLSGTKSISRLWPPER